MGTDFQRDASSGSRAAEAAIRCSGEGRGSVSTEIPVSVAVTWV